jgi:tetratricopeptide (TPR) repeat protein
MKYDRLGFPIPPEFTPPDDRSTPGPARRLAPSAGSREEPAPPRRMAGRGKRLFLLGLLAAVIVPGVLAPGVMPVISDAVVQWSLERAIAHEGRGDVRSAVRDVSRAISWAGLDTERRCRLLCWRAMLRIENRDPEGAMVDADAALAIAPTLTQPRRVRALAHVILNKPDGALADAQTAVEIAGPGDPEALNHRAYIRALVGRDLEAALADIDAALPPDGEGSPEFLDTKGFVLHLLGRHHEAVDLLNVAIDATQKTRRRLMELSPHADPDELAYRVRSVDHALAVMHQHRGLACRALGLAGQAAQDLETAERKGYAPQRGIF